MDRKPTQGQSGSQEKPGHVPNATWMKSGTGPLVLATIGIEFGLVIVVMTLAGWWLDEKWGISPTLMIVGACMGTIGGIYNFWRKGKRFFPQKPVKRSAKPQSPGSQDHPSGQRK